MIRDFSRGWPCCLALFLAAFATTCDPGVYLEDCPGGYMVDGICRLKDCPTRECPEGFICDNDICVEIDCLGVECAVDEACAHGSCFPKGCETRNCPGVGEVCIEDECHSASCVCTVDADCPTGATCVNNVCECPAGQACAAGQCYPTDCPTKTCPGYGEVCIDDECVEQSCVGVECNEGESCAGGFCYPDDCTDVGCFGEGEICIDGVCQRRACVDVECQPGFVCANGWCYPQDCAGVDCSDYGEVCYNDECVQVDCVGIDCPAGQRCARGECFPENCGGEVCASYEVCYQDQCIRTNCVGVVCPPGERCADGECVPKDCGQTGCGDGEVCIDGQCVAENCAHVDCPPGEVCGADLQCYPEDCGGTQCSEYEMCVGGVCVDRMCVGVTCPAGQVCAAGNCYDPDCGIPCGADEVCENGVCVTVDCAGGRCCPPVACGVTSQCVTFTCDGVDLICLLADGATEGDWSDPAVMETDVDNCGGCRTLCRRANATPQCTGGVCSIGQCDDLWGDCDGDDQNGCETSLETLTDCGGCGVPCEYPGTEMDCTGGVCQIANCEPGFGDCDGVVTNGCENTLDSLTDCGGCGITCDRDHATPSCAGDVCHIESCDALWGDCNTTDADGCEASLETTTNCSTCGTACVRANATAECPGGTCRIQSCNPLWDDCNGTDADGCEVSLETLTDCGACGVPCDYPGTEMTCAGGICQIANCDPGFGDCDGLVTNGCENTLDSLTDCGSCGTPCSRDNATASCAGDVCHIETCNTGWGDCDGNDANGCEDPLDGLVNCGTCGTPCSRAHATASCAGESCHIETCDSLYDDCNSIDADGCEISLETLTDCGACGVPCDYPGAEMTCTGGICQIANCDPGWGDCDGVVTNGCENTLDSLQNCGACGITCDRDHATPSCSGDTCHIESCDSLWDNCNGQDADGCETSLETTTDCGFCNTPCGLPHSTAHCTGGNCQIGSCDPLWDDCNHLDSDGCETSLETTTDCGSCGNPCSRAHATPSCSGGSCHIGSCDSLWGDCNLIDSDGCEQTLTTLGNCGSCGNPCSLPHAGEECSTGTCLITSCDSLWGDCDGQHSTGCEQTLTTLNHCGGCGDACSLNHASESCATGQCLIVSCDTLWDDCNHQDSDGCETSLETNTNCGSCGNPCSAAGATTSCAGGTCHITSCNPGLGDCDGSLGNGCETDLTSTDAHCGSCGHDCGQNAYCSSSTCHCNSNWGNCDNNWNNGCETDLRITAAHCGTCGHYCGQNAYCSGSTCHCNSNWGNCDNNWNNGCETDLRITAAHCGTCNNNCGQNAYCSSSTCHCNANYANCDGLWTNGCEADLLNDNNHCGSCTHDCGSNAYCSSGSCHCNPLWGDCDGLSSNGCEQTLTTLQHCGACNDPCSLPHANETCPSGTCQIQSCDSLWDNCNGNHDDGCEQSLEELDHCGSCAGTCYPANGTGDCAGGICQITGCSTGYYNVNGVVSDGCECGDTSDVSDSCSGAPSVGASSTQTGVIVYGGGRNDWDCFSVTHNVANPPKGGGTFSIRLSGTGLVFNVTGSDTCTGDFEYDTSCNSTGTTCEDGNNGTYCVCVRSSGSNVCSGYTLTLSQSP